MFRLSAVTLLAAGLTLAAGRADDPPAKKADPAKKAEKKAEPDGRVPGNPKLKRFVYPEVPRVVKLKVGQKLVIEEPLDDPDLIGMKVGNEIRSTGPAGAGTLFGRVAATTTGVRFEFDADRKGKGQATWTLLYNTSPRERARVIDFVVE